jgi:hypothetical protein
MDGGTGHAGHAAPLHVVDLDLARQRRAHAVPVDHHDLVQAQVVRGVDWHREHQAEQRHPVAPPGARGHRHRVPRAQNV